MAWKYHQIFAGMGNRNKLTLVREYSWLSPFPSQYQPSFHLLVTIFKLEFFFILPSSPDILEKYLEQKATIIF